jgi:hypothetical protein
MKFENVGCLVTTALVCGGLGFMAWGLFREGAADAAAAEDVARLRPWSRGDGPPAAGTRLLAVGRIDPQTPVVHQGKGLALHVREVCDMSLSGRRRRTQSYTWREADRNVPVFRLLVGDAALTVKAVRTFRHPTLDEPGREAAGAVRDKGFRAGDLVLVDGRVGPDGVRADVLFGGDHDAYVAALRGDGPSATKSGWQVVGAMALVAALATWYLRRRPAAPPAGAAAARGRA